MHKKVTFIYWVRNIFKSVCTLLIRPRKTKTLQNNLETIDSICAHKTEKTEEYLEARIDGQFNRLTTIDIL